MTGDDLLTTGEVAELVRGAAKTVRSWRYLGTGPAYVKRGGRVLYARADVDAWLAARRVAPTR